MFDKDAVKVIMAIAIVSAFFIGLLLWGQSDPGLQETTELVPAALDRAVDSDAGVVCWSRHQFGVSCLPCEVTKLECGDDQIH